MNFNDERSSLPLWKFYGTSPELKQVRNAWDQEKKIKINKISCIMDYLFTTYGFMLLDYSREY
jgi:hypothetical protein